MITAPALEIAVVLLGLLVLLLEAFAEKIDKRSLALLGVAGLSAILLATFFLQGGPRARRPASGPSTPPMRSRSSLSASRS